MRAIRRLLRRMTAWTTTSRDEARLRDELETHVAMQTADNMRAGLSAGEARRQAVLKLGNVEATKEMYRDQRGLPALETLARDTRHAFRRLRRAPAFTATVILTLALSIGANTAIFGVIERVLIRPLDYPESERLVAVRLSAPGLSGLPDNIGLAASHYFTYREENRTFQHFGLASSGGASVTGLAEPELPRAMFVTAGVLDAIGVRPQLGRWFATADERPGSAETVILTHGYWQRRLGGDPSIVGRTMTINGKPHTVVGVMPETFRFHTDPELILPHRFERATLTLGGFGHQGIARLKPGVTTAQADVDVARMLNVWLDAWPLPPGIARKVFEDARLMSRTVPMKQEIVGDIGATLWVVMGTLGLVLAIACANVANLMLVRAEARRQEIAVRAALGAGWARIAREMLVETMTLGIIGGGAGLVLAFGALRILVTNGPDTLPRLHEIAVDPFVVAFALGVAVLSGVLFGLIPVWRYARPGVGAALRGPGRTSSHGPERQRARNALVVVQVALALVLLVGSGLMIRTFQQLRRVPPGFTRPEAVQIIHANVPQAIADDPERVMRLQHEILDKLAAIPGVESVGLGSAAPLESFLGAVGNPVYAEDRPSERQVASIRQIRKIAPGFFTTVGTRVVAGRDFTWTDMYDKRRVAIVSENLARELWGEPQTALGKRIREAGTADVWREIVGVVENVYDNGVHVKPPEFAYWPALMDQYVWGGPNGFALGSAMFAIRSSRAGTEGLLAEAQQAIWSVNGRQPVYLVTTLQTLYDQSMARTSFTLVMLAIAGVMALVLGVVGLYGVIAYVVSQHTREIGIRTALGAPPAGLSRLFVRQGLLLAGVGTLLGLVAAAGLTRLMSSLLFGVTALDPVTYLAVSVLLFLAALLASYLPARRAMTIDPVQALQGE